MKKIVLAAAVSAALVFAAPSHAQFGNLLNRGGEQSNAGDAQAVVDSFVTSYGQVLTAQVHFAEALGLQTQVDELRAQQEVLGSGSIDTERLEKVSEVSESAQRAINERQQAQPELDANAKAAYGAGLVSLFEGIMTGRDVVTNASAVGSSLGSNPAAMMGSGRTAAYVVRQAPGYLRTVQETARMAVEFGQSNGIEAPSNATSLLEGM